MSTIYLIIIKLKCILHDLLSNNIIVRITNILVFNSFEVLCNIILKLIIIILPIILILLNSNDYNKFNIVEAQELNINKVNKSNIHNISKTPNKLIKADDVSSINYGFTKDIINTIVAPDNKTQKSNFNKYLLNNPNNLNHSGINYDKICGLLVLCLVQNAQLKSVNVNQFFGFKKVLAKPTAQFILINI